MKVKYFDYAATTPVDEKVLSKMMPYFTERFGNPSSLYSIGVDNKEIVTLSKMKIAKILNVDASEIYFTSCGSESDNLIIKGIAFANSNKGNHIITSSIEHPAVLETCKTLEKFGFRVTYLNPDKNGLIDVEKVRRNIRNSTILISIMYANNEIGTIQKISKIGEIARYYNIPFHTDAVQVVGSLDINVKKLNVDAMSFSSHKFYGPKGVGIAYISKNINFRRIQDGGHQENNKRAGTENVPGIVGTAEAFYLAEQDKEINNNKILNLRNYYIKEILENISCTKLNGDIKERIPSNANILFSNVDGNMLVKYLNERDICTSSGSACSAGLINPSHVLLAMGVNNIDARSSLRVTFGKDSNIEDTKYLIENIIEGVKNLRK